MLSDKKFGANSKTNMNMSGTLKATNLSNNVEHCHSCLKSFGLFTRKYQCIHCEQYFCSTKTCSEQRMQKINGKMLSARTCNKCKQQRLELDKNL